MKKQLEIKHLAGYLPYGLKLKTNSWNYKETYTLFSLDMFGFGFKEGELFLSRCKPILRPLSDLTKHCEDLGFVPTEWFEIGDDSNNSIEYGYGNIKLIGLLRDMAKHNFIHLEYINHGVIQKLLEWHFDIYGLIEQNLAIDINTL